MSDSVPAAIPGGGNAYLGREVELPKKILELNPSLALLKELQKLEIEQIY